MLSRPEYYRLGHIDPDTVIRYDFDEIPKKLLATKMYGPWDLPEEIL